MPRAALKRRLYPWSCGCCQFSVCSKRHENIIKETQAFAGTRATGVASNRVYWQDGGRAHILPYHFKGVFKKQVHFKLNAISPRF